MGGAFFASGNVNPVAEANIYGDPDAADLVFTSREDIDVVGINITYHVCFKDDDLLELKNSKGLHAQFLSNMCNFYRDFHTEYEGLHVMFVNVWQLVSRIVQIESVNFTTNQLLMRQEKQKARDNIDLVGVGGDGKGSSLADDSRLMNFPEASLQSCKLGPDCA